MNVDQLIELLKEYPPDTKVLISRDPEGNGFAHLCELSYSHYSDDYEVEVYHPDDIDERKRWAESDQEDYQEPEKAIVLWP